MTGDEAPSGKAPIDVEGVVGPAALLRLSPWHLRPNAALAALLAPAERERDAFSQCFESPHGELIDLLMRQRPFKGRLHAPFAAAGGHWRLLHVDFMPQPESTEWLCTFVDLSPIEDEHMRRSLTLQHLNDTLYRLQDSISLVTHDELVLFGNPAYALLFSPSNDEVDHLPLKDVMGEVNYEVTAPYRRTLFETSEPVRYERVLVDREGQERVMDVMLRPILDGNGRAIRMATLSRNVTSRHQGMVAIRRNLERLDALFEAGIEGILLCEGGRIRDANPVAARHLDTTREALVGQPLDSVWAMLGLAPLLAHANGPPDLDLHLCRLPQGAGTPPLTIQCIEFTDEGRACHAVLLQDMSYRLQAQRRIDRLVADLRQQTAKATAADQGKSVFLAAASHDLRQPIHSLGLFLTTVQSLVRSATPLDRKTLRPIAQRMRASLDSLTQLLDALLGASVLRANNEAVTLQPVALQSVFDAVLTEFAPVVAGKGLRLKAVPCRAWVLTDPVVLRRIVTNLVANAVRYTRRGRVVIGARARGSQMEIQVWDTGVGIPGEQLGAIFETFYRVDLKVPRGERAEGLGLSIVKRAATQLGARLDVRSTEHRGSMFSVTQPRCPPQRADPAMSVTHPPAASGAPRCVLLIDDDEQVRDATVDLLTAWGHTVIVAANANEALRACESDSHRIDAVLCDYIDGPVIEQLEHTLRRRAQGNGPIPFCMVTGDMSAERLEQARQHGLQLLHKPVSAAALRQFLLMAG